jgi:multidrug efflux pump subunit AcrA (membrane-fusion protein)
MSEQAEDFTPKPPSHLLRNLGLALAAIYVVASLYLIVELRGRVAGLEKGQQANAVAIKDQGQRFNRDLKASNETLGSKLGMTQQELQHSLTARASQLERQQRASEERIEQEHKQAYTQVTGEVAGVKTEVGSARTDIASARADLEATRQKLERAIGDLNVQSGLIAHTREDLDYLKHRGDRNYYEFTLKKGAHPTPVSTVSLQLKKADQKKSRFTLNVIADDRTIEKKDRSVSEPLQFITGRDRTLYELVVMSVDKDKVSGYLSTPKNVPPPGGLQ